MSRQPDELPNEHVLCYPPELQGNFLRADDDLFSCIKSSAEEPKRYKDQIDNKAQ